MQKSILEWAACTCMYVLLSSKLYEGETNESYTWQGIFIGIAARLTVMEEDISGSQVDC